MEISIIINIVFISLFLIGFASYLIWLGFNLIKVRRQMLDNINRYHNDVDSIYKRIETVDIDNRNIIEEKYLSTSKKIDRLDSKFDREIDRIDNRISEEFKDILNMLPKKKK